MHRQDACAAKASLKGGKNFSKRSRPRDNGQLGAGTGDCRSRFQPFFKKTVVHHVRLLAQPVRTRAMMCGVERRVHNDEIERPVGKPGALPFAAGKRHVGFKNGNARSKPGIGRKGFALPCKGRHFGGTFHQHDICFFTTGGYGKTCCPGTGAQIGQTPGEITGHGAGEQHCIEPGPMAPAGWLDQMEATAMKRVNGEAGIFLGRDVRHGVTGQLRTYIQDSYVGKEPSRLFCIFLRYENAARQNTERPFHDAHVAVSHQEFDARIPQQALGKGDGDGVVGSKKLNHEVTLAGPSRLVNAIEFPGPARRVDSPLAAMRAAVARYASFEMHGDALCVLDRCVRASGKLFARPMRQTREARRRVQVGVVVNLEGGKRGAATIERLIELTKDDMGRVNELILSKAGSDVELIPQLARHLISSGGKRLRPMVTLAAAQMFGYTGEGHVKLATSVEFMHTATLLHDDVVDESDLRRGRETARTIWGNQASVLVGDFLLGQAFRMMVEVGVLEALDVLSTAAAVIAEGEVMQLGFAKNLETTEDEYLDVIKAKTAALFSAAAEVGPIIAEASRNDRAALRSFGANLGLAFQLVDDALDYGGTTNELGKNVGDDFREGKVTLPVILSYRRGSEEERLFWKRAIEQNENDDDALERAVGLMSKYGSIGDTIGRARHFGEIARDALAPLKNTPEKSALVDVIDFCISRVL